MKLGMMLGIGGRRQLVGSLPLHIVQGLLVAMIFNQKLYI